MFTKKSLGIIQNTLVNKKLDFENILDDSVECNLQLKNCDA